MNSYNRNFPKRNDGSANTLSFVTSPDTVVALALAGTLDFDPTTGTLTNDAGESVRLGAPVGEILPDKGFDPGESGFLAPPEDSSDVEVVVDPASERLQVLEPFPAWDGNDYVDLPVLMKALGKCTTDHISAAGKWLRYRGHLENISGNLFLGVVNAFTGATGEGKDQTDGETRSFPETAKRYGEQGVSWAAVGDQNYGEGSSRDAAMEPRFRGGKVIFARSFARIHDEPEEAGPAAADVHRSVDLRPDRRGRPHQRARAATGARPAGAVPHLQARRHHDRFHGDAHVQRRTGGVVPRRLRAEHRPREGRPRRGLTGHPEPALTGRTNLVELDAIDFGSRRADSAPRDQLAPPPLLGLPLPGSTAPSYRLRIQPATPSRSASWRHALGTTPLAPGP